ncbi:MAG: ABC transporter ATP-binding protein [Lachnospiraceae bacterium]|nr:ABC transporter ATP-binding protein [Lachnospiraceae bacterium]
MIFSVENVSCGYQGHTVLSDLSFSATDGSVLCILGPNGIGKTTLFRTLMGLLPCLGGDIRIDDRSTLKWSARQRARVMGFVPQSHVPPFPYTVRQVVVMGRSSHLGMFSSPGEQDYALADDILRSLGIENLGERVYTRISGGERQMALIARALIQSPQILLMDEPAANLDLANQVMVLETIRKLADRGIIVIMTTHSPDHAFLCGTEALLLTREGYMIHGVPEQVVTTENMRRVYGVEVCITTARKQEKLIRGCVPVMDSRTNSSTPPFQAMK